MRKSQPSFAISRDLQYSVTGIRARDIARKHGRMPPEALLLMKSCRLANPSIITPRLKPSQPLLSNFIIDTVLHWRGTARARPRTRAGQHIQQSRCCRCEGELLSCCQFLQRCWKYSQWLMLKIMVRRERVVGQKAKGTYKKANRF